MNRRRCVLSLLLCVSLILDLMGLPFLTACSRNSDPTATQSRTPATAATASPTTPIGVVPAPGVASLPPGSSLKMTDLRVLSCLGETAVKPDGSFSAKELGDGVAAVALTNAQGKIVLVGYVDAASPKGTISPETTAVWLLTKVFSSLLPSSSPRGEFIKMLLDTAEAKQLAAVISARVAANPTALADGDEKIISAIESAVSSLQASIRSPARVSSKKPTGTQAFAEFLKNASRAVPAASLQQVSTRPSPGTSDEAVHIKQVLDGVPEEPVGPSAIGEAQAPAKLIVEGDQKSGVVVTSDTSQSLDPKVNGFVVANTRRRHLWYDIYRVGYWDKDLTYKAVEPEKIRPSNTLLPDFTFCPAVGAYSGVVGTLVDYITGDMPLKEETSLPVELYMNPDEAAKTKYAVVVTGPGSAGAGKELGDYLPEEIKNNASYRQDVYNQFSLMSLATVFTEMAIPVLFDWFPEGTMQSLIDLTQPNIAEPFLRMTEEQLKSILQAGSVAGTNLAIWDYKGLAIAFLRMLADDPSFRAAYVKAVLNLIVKGDKVELAAQFAKLEATNLFVIMKVFDKILSVIDVSTVYVHILRSNPADYWYVTAVPPAVRLDPNTASVASGDRISLKATAPGVTGTLTWRFFCTNKQGYLLASNGTDQTSEIESSNPEVTYVAKTDSEAGAGDEIVVKAYLKVGTEVRDLGLARAMITIGSKELRYWYLGGGDTPNVGIDIPIDTLGLQFKLNGKNLPEDDPAYDVSYFMGNVNFGFYARAGDSLEIRYLDRTEPGIRYDIGPIWLHQWDGAKKAKLMDHIDLPIWTSPETGKPETVWVKTFTIPSLPIDHVELSYDDGSSDGGVSLGGRAQYGFHVGFTYNTPFFFKVTKIKIYSWIKSTPTDGSQFTVWLGEREGETSWKASLPYTLFTTEPSWLEIEVPSQVMYKEFFVRLYAPSLAAGTGPYVGADQSGTNTHSEMISKYQKDVQTGYRHQIVEWSLKEPPKEETNWMIRVEGNEILGPLDRQR
jgi:hypothetical protein